MQIGSINFGDKVVLIGSIFYSKHRIVHDADKGIFDRDRAEKLIKKQEELEDKFRIQGILDVVAESGEALINYVDFVAEVTDKPFILDGYVEARVAALKHAAEVGLLDRVIYNSINPINTKDEIRLIQELGLKNAVVFDYDPAYTSPHKRLMLLTGDGKKEGLIPKAKKLGIENMLIDVVPTDLKSLGEVIEALLLVKSTFEYPAGCGPANVSYYMADFLKKELDVKILVSSVDSVAQLFSDFIFYGPIERAPVAFESAYVVEEVKEGLSFDFHKLMGLG